MLGQKLDTRCPRCGKTSSYRFHGRYKFCSNCGRDNRLEDHLAVVYSIWKHSPDALIVLNRLPDLTEYLENLKKWKPNIPLPPKYEKLLSIYKQIKWRDKTLGGRKEAEGDEDN